MDDSWVRRPHLHAGTRCEGVGRRPSDRHSTPEEPVPDGTLDASRWRSVVPCVRRLIAEVPGEESLAELEAVGTAIARTRG